MGPVLAAQMGYLPGLLWILAGVVFAGAVQDFIVLFISTRRDGRSLGDLIKQEMGTVPGMIALFGTFMIMIIILAVLALIVVKALAESPWGTFTVAATIPVAIFMGIYLRFIRPGTDLDTLLRTSDVVTLHCPLTPETKHLINAKRLATMKPTAFLLNTSRGPLIDEAALTEALTRGQIAGAGLDVLSEEPPPADHPLYTAPNCFITPHIAWATRAARARLMRIAVENVRAFINGKPQNVVT